MKMVEIEALKPFNKAHHGDICKVGERFSVGETRAGELEANGLARRTKPRATPVNKMLPEPETPAPKAIVGENLARTRSRP